jgi:hypothetical protein
VLVRTFLLSEDYRPFTSNGTVVPFRMDIPDDWTPRPSAASDLVLGPSPTTADDVFFHQGREPEDWAEVTRAIRSGSSDAVGMYAYAQSAGFDDTSAQTVKAFVGQVLPEPTEIGEPQGVPVVGAMANELVALASDPRNPDTQLRLLVDVVASPGQGTLVLAFFAPPDTFEDHRSTFEKVRDSLEITR